MFRTRLSALALAVVAGMGAGCSAGPAPSVPQPTRTTQTASSPGGTSGTPTSSAPNPSGSGTAVPACISLSLTGRATLTGSALGACLVDAATAAGSGKEKVTTPSSGIDARFRYRDSIDVAGTVEGGDGLTEFVLIGRDSYGRLPGGWVRGDPSSADAEERKVGAAAAAYRRFADPRAALGLVSVVPRWKVRAEQEKVARPDGTSVPAWRLQSTEGFAVQAFVVSEMVVWLGEDRGVLGLQAVLGTGDAGETVTIAYYDWGLPVQIDRPS